MTEDFKKGLATGIAIGGINVNKQVMNPYTVTERVCEAVMLPVFINSNVYDSIILGVIIGKIDD